MAEGFSLPTRHSSEGNEEYNESLTPGNTPQIVSRAYTSVVSEDTVGTTQGIAGTSSDSDSERNDAGEVPTEVPFDIETTQDDAFDTEMISMVDVNQRVVQAYLSERYAPHLLQNPLSNSSIRHLRRVNIQTLDQLQQSYPSLEPRERVLFVAAKQASDRSTFLLQSFVALRLWKLLNEPYTSWNTDDEPPSSDVAQTPDIQSFNTPGPSSGQLSTAQSSECFEAQALNILEQALARDIQAVWDTFNIVSPSNSADHKIVHAHVPPYGLPVECSELNVSSPSSHTSHVLRVLPTLQGRAARRTSTAATPSTAALQMSQTQSASYPLTDYGSLRTPAVTETSDESGPKLMPGTVLTVGYDIVKQLVEKGALGLVG